MMLIHVRFMIDMWWLIEMLLFVLVLMLRLWMIMIIMIDRGKR